MSNSIPVVWTNDDIHSGKSAELKRQLDFLDRHGIPGVFFVIPQARRDPANDLDKDQDLIALIKDAEQRGHEFYQHGFQHHPFECGIPDLGMLEVDSGAARYFDTRRSEVEKLHTLEAQMEMLENGSRIWKRAFGRTSSGFRPGWGAYCENFYKALALLGYNWVSSKIPCMTSWAWTIEKWDRPIDFREGMPTSPHLLEHGIWEYPIAGDYAFRVPQDPTLISRMVQLGLDEFEVFSERSDPMLILSHWFGLEHLESTGYAVHEKLLPALKATNRARFVGMKDLVETYQNRQSP